MCLALGYVVTGKLEAGKRTQCKGFRSRSQRMCLPKCMHLNAGEQSDGSCTLIVVPGSMDSANHTIRWQWSDSRRVGELL